MIDITPVEPNANSVVYNAFDRVDYRDAFRVSFPSGTFADISQFAKVYFTSQPTWLRMVSMNILNKETLAETINNSEFKVGEKIGSWGIHDISDNEIVFGESMGFMDYRFSMRLDKSDSDLIEVSTVVKINSFMGKFYFAIVKLLHKRFVIKSLRYTIMNA